jgi:protein-S-isoprenylcysteine O-methyltransferase Ste14
MKRLAVLVYGGVSYALAMATIVYSIAFVGGFAPKSVDAGGPPTPVLLAAAIDLALLGIFAIQHSVMARRQFKAWWTRMVPAPIERSTYVLFSALALILLFWQWRPIDGTIWQIDQPVAAALLTALFWIGWAVVFISTFLINHFDLFGLSQVWAAWRGTRQHSPDFRTPFFYKVVRHPIYFGFLLAFWATPAMSQGHLLFAVATTAYLFIGIWLEERDLVAMFGDIYTRYRARVSMIVPLPPRRGG